MTFPETQSDLLEAHSNLPEAQSNYPEARSDLPDAQSDLPWSLFSYHGAPSDLTGRKVT